MNGIQHITQNFIQLGSIRFPFLSLRYKERTSEFLVGNDPGWTFQTIRGVKVPVLKVEEGKRIRQLLLAVRLTGYLVKVIQARGVLSGSGALNVNRFIIHVLLHILQDKAGE